MFDKAINKPDYKTKPLEETLELSIIDPTEELIEVNAVLSALRDRIRQLPRRERIVCALYFFGGETEKGIAWTLRKSVSTIRRSLKKLKEVLK